MGDSDLWLLDHKPFSGDLRRRAAGRSMAPVLARFVAPLDGVARVEALRCQRMGAFKWKDPGLGYRLADTPRPGGALVDRVCHQFAARRRRVYPAPAHPETVIRCAQRPSNGGAGGVFGC